VQGGDGADPLGAIHVTPLTVMLDGCLVHIIEVIRSKLFDTKWYHVVLRIDCGTIKTRTFTIPARSNRELKEKIRAEIAKIKMLAFVAGPDFAREVVGG